MSFRGDLQSIAVADVVQNLGIRGQTGTLTVVHDLGVYRIAFDGGEIVGCAAEPGGDLAVTLAASDRVAPDLLAKAEALRGRCAMPLGEALVRVGALEPGAARALLRGLAAEDLYDALALTEGRFHFRPGRPDVEPEQRWARIRLPPETAVMEAARRADDWSFVASHVSSGSNVLELSDGLDGPPGAASAVAAAILEAVDGRRSLEEVARRLPHSRLEVFRAAAQLVADGVLRPVSRPGTGGAAAGRDGPSRRPGTAPASGTSLLRLWRHRPRLPVKGAVALLVGLLSLYGAYDLAARLAVARVTRSVFADRLLEGGECEEAIRRYEDVRAQFPASAGALIEASRALAGLRAARDERGLPSGAR